MSPVLPKKWKSKSLYLDLNLFLLLPLLFQLSFLFLLLPLIFATKASEYDVVPKYVLRHISSLRIPLFTYSIVSSPLGAALVRETLNISQLWSQGTPKINDVMPYDLC